MGAGIACDGDPLHKAVQGLIERLIVPQHIDFGAWDVDSPFPVEFAESLFEFIEVVFASGGAAGGDELIVEFHAVFFIQMECDNELLYLTDTQQVNSAFDQIKVNVASENRIEYILRFRKID